MPIVTADRVRETSSSSSTGAISLGGAATGFRAFSSVMSVGDTCYYAITNQAVPAEWEVGLGTYSAVNTLTRTTILASSNSGTAVNFSSGTKDVFLTIAASAATSASNLTSGTLSTARGGTALGATPSNGQLLIGTGTGYSLATLTAGTGVTITNGAGTIQIDATGGGGGGVTGFAPSQSTVSPNNTTYASALTASGTATDIDAVLAPKGIGAVLAQVPDSTVAGGNKRGQNAVDLQTSRTAAPQVASGAYASILGGGQNTASGTYSTAFGYNNIASGGYSVAGGYGSIAGGYTATSFGMGNTASGNYSVANGQGASTRGVIGKQAYATYYFGSVGDSQIATHVLCRQTTTATTTVLTTNGSSITSTANVVSLPINSAASFRGRVVARNTSTNDTAMWEFYGLIKCGASPSTITMVGSTITKVYSDAGASSWSVTLGPDTANGALQINITGAAATIRWTGRVDTEETT